MRNYTAILYKLHRGAQVWSRISRRDLWTARGTYSLLSHRGLAVAYRPLTRTVAAGGARNGYCGHD